LNHSIRLFRVGTIHQNDLYERIISKPRPASIGGFLWWIKASLEKCLVWMVWFL